ncbi:DUF421 domain-containing protein [Marilutibacter chinensis]|uniref:DUF421 domain-containing protein n=1 Tax=Marilutibacter chinensis TaxID=2912247 RepID=A0ABS9HTJ1_9GAMM|nr:YetF domain-containing protein [Lysobacter chinensis]MCF7222224.1 DUF421 domain-containing protein [Lysobacter chinensis]
MDLDIEVFDWERMLLGLPPPLYFAEIVVKTLMVFAVLLLVLRMLGKRGQQNLSPMSQLLMVALGSAAGDAILYPEVPVGYAVVILLGVVGLTMGMETLAEHHSKVRDYLESRPQVLVRDGVVDQDALDRERTTLRELHAKLRMAGARDLSEVEVAILEVTGEISVICRPSGSGGRRNLVDYILEDAPKPEDIRGTEPTRMSPARMSQASRES